MNEEIDFMSEENVWVEGDEKAVLTKMVQRETANIPDPEAIIKAHIRNMENNIAENLFLVLQDGSEIDYKRLPDPKCAVCSSVFCQEVERLYVEEGFNLDVVQSFFKEKDIKLAKQSVRSHFERHCDFGHLKENWLVKAQIRKDEIIQNNDQLTELLMGDCIDTIMLIKDKIKYVSDVKDLAQLLNVLPRFHSAIVQYERLRSEKKTREDELQEKLTSEHMAKLEAMFAELISGSSSDAEKQRILQLLAKLQG